MDSALKRNTQYITLEHIFLITYAIFVSKNIIFSSMIQDILPGSANKLIRMGLLGIIFIYLCLSRYNRKRFIVAACFAVLALYQEAFNGYTDFMLSLLLCVCYDGYEFRKILKVTFLVTLFSMLFVIATCFIGLIPNLEYSQDNKALFSYGFKYYTTTAFITMFCSMSYISMRGKKCTILEFVLVSIINIGVYMVTSADIMLVTIAFFLILFFLVYKLRIPLFRFKVIKALCYLAPIACAGISLYVAKIYSPSNHILYTVNKILRSRISLGHSAFSKVGASLFGQNIKMVGMTEVTYGDYVKADYFYIDNAYLYSFFAYGIIAFAIIIVLYICLIRKFLKDKNDVLLIGTLTVLVACICNNFIVSLTYYPVLMLAVYSLRSRKGDFVDERNTLRKRNPLLKKDFSVE